MMTNFPFVAGAIFLLLAESIPGADGRIFTVDDMLSAEQFGRVELTPDGNRLLYERLRPFENQPDFGRGDAYRPNIWMVDAQSHQKPYRLLEDSADGLQIQDLSPDGKWLAYRRAATDGEYLGVVSLHDRVSREFAFPPEYFERPIWLSGSLIYPALEAGTSRFVYAMRVEQLNALSARWNDAREGKIPTSSVLVSGRKKDLSAGGGFLSQVDLDTGRVRRLAEGRFADLRLSPDGRTLAALRQGRLALRSVERIEHGVNTGGTGHALVVLAVAAPHERASGIAPTEPCTRCDVLPGSLVWSPDGRYLAFAARQGDADWSDASYHVYDRDTGRAGAVQLGGLRPHGSQDAARDVLRMESAWFGENLAVKAAEPSGSFGNSAEKGLRAQRPDWFLAGSEQPVNLTEGFDGEPPQLLAAQASGGVFLHGGKVWLVDVQGSWHRLAPLVDRPLEPLPSQTPVAPVHPSGKQIVLLGRHRTAPDHLVFIDLESGAVEVIEAPRPSARFVAFSRVGQRAATVHQAGHVSQLSLVAAGSTSSLVAEVNPDFKTVSAGEPVRLDHAGSDGGSRHSWMLLPPGYERDRPLPTIVNVYPGRTGGPQYNGWTIDRASALNDHLLAAGGYAVLYPSLPLRRGEGLGNPLDGLEANVFAAVDAAVAQGLADPERLAVQGQSHGGYAAAALVGLTNRFKAAVASAGIYNLVSFYGVFDPRAWLDVETRGLRMFGASWLETGLGRIGAPPWQASEHYLRNSPLMLVEAVETPIMLIHGDRDFVSITQAEEYFTALTRLGKEAEFVRYLGEDHVVKSPANIRDMRNRLFAWYEKHLGPPYTPLKTGSDDHEHEHASSR
jgi:dipeptidyl aminopeptidase/acylaminoacyl peptidase